MKQGSKGNPIVVVREPFDWHYRGYLHSGHYCEGYAHSGCTDISTFVESVLKPLGFAEVTNAEVVGVHPAYKVAA